jgi:transposase-like protein
MIADSWRTHWPQITPFLALPEELRRAVLACTPGSC